MHRKKIRRSFLLIEILTASFVAGIVIAVCLSFLFLFTTVRTKEDLQFRDAQKLLQRSTSLRAVLSFIETEPKDHNFLVEDGPGGQKRLVFYTDAGHNVTPERSSTQKTMLYVDSEMGLVLVQKPISGKTDKTQINDEEFSFKEKACSIWPTAESVRWSFFDLPEVQEVLDSTPEEESGGWKDTWEKKEPPLAIKAYVSDSSLAETPIEVTALVLSRLNKVKIQG